jgi:hypothetical protein
VQRKWRRLHPGEKAPDDKANQRFRAISLNRWLKQFKETGGVKKHKSSGRPGTSEQSVKRIRQSYVRSPKKSTARWTLELWIPKTTIQIVIHKRLRLYAYKIQLKREPISILHTIKQTQPSVAWSTSRLTLTRIGK